MAVRILIKILSIVCFMPLVLHAQTSKELREGNKLYKEKKFDQSLSAYNKALEKTPGNATTNYNAGNANFRNNKYDEAIQSFDNTIAGTNDKALKQNAYYNKGVSLSKQKKLAESIEAYKEALKLNSNDNDTRENLQKALMELKQQQQQKNKQDKKDDKKNKDKQKDQDKKEDQQPKEQQSKLNKQQVEQLLQALQQKEKEVQKKLQAKEANSAQPDKDW